MVAELEVGVFCSGGLADLSFSVFTFVGLVCSLETT